MSATDKFVRCCASSKLLPKPVGPDPDLNQVTPSIYLLPINQLLDALAQCASEHLGELVDPDPKTDKEGPGGYRQHGPEQQGRRLLSRAPSLPLPYLRI
jgi:hypothetical protein